RTEIFSTVVDGQQGAEIRVFQGEDEDTRYNTLVGEFKIEGLADVTAGNQIVVRLDLDLSGILKVTATERITSLARRVTIDNAMERFRKRQRTDAVDRLEAIFETAEGAPEAPPAPATAPDAPVEDDLTPGQRQAIRSAHDLIAKAENVLPRANPEDAAELGALLTDLRSAVAHRSEDEIRRVTAEVEDLVFYLEDH
ncbi:MAG TPA: Hsp70 family protein, partial [Isosphaeraceae bacterium]|nr:Hsp70 family protein [Isosphaeraceae bacterium]